MRRIIALLTVSALFVLAAIPAFAENEKVTVCHNTDNDPHEITVSENAWPAHQAQGDTLGPCDDDFPDDNGDGLD